MDSLNLHKIKLEKTKPVVKSRQLRKLANMFRLIEICVVLILISRISIQIPVAFKNSGGYFRNISIILMSPRFVFILGNMIVIALFAKSGQLSSHGSDGKSSGTDLYEEFVQKSEKNQFFGKYEMKNRGKQRIGEETRLRECQSEIVKVDHHERPARVLQRSETEKIRKSNSCGERLMKNSYPEDEMSSEEFRRTVEAFIARQQRFLREEESYSPF